MTIFTRPFVRLTTCTHVSAMWARERLGPRKERTQLPHGATGRLRCISRGVVFSPRLFATRCSYVKDNQNSWRGESSRLSHTNAQCCEVLRLPSPPPLHTTCELRSPLLFWLFVQHSNWPERRPHHCCCVTSHTRMVSCSTAHMRVNWSLPIGR